MSPRLGFALALACCVLAAAGGVEQAALDGTVLVGELALDGRLRPVRGVLPCLLAARAAGVRRAVVPDAALVEAALVDGLAVFGAATLTQVLAWLAGTTELARPGPPTGVPAGPPPDLADVVGQDDARRALEVAAAGAGNPRHHNMRNADLQPWSVGPSVARGAGRHPVERHRRA